MGFHTYLLRCADGSYYAGHTDNLEQRIGQHQTGVTGGYTARRRPLVLVWCERFDSRDDAFAAERKIKGWSRAKKEALIAGDWALVSELARNRQGRATILRQAQDERGGDGSLGEERSAALDEVILSLSKGEQPNKTSAPVQTTLSPQAHAAILHAATQAHPNEACGLLFGTASHIIAAERAANVHPQPHRHFEIDPAALIAAHKAARAGGPELIGYFHSHPNGLACPSETDAAMASGDGRIWAIAAGGDVSLWRDAPSGFEALSYRFKEG
ncbi:Mov34/MPN/PAD-1 family protein [Novosphingobium sp. NDB2Meth1]|uniref:Mov34/MPN/PAD-1 family protein n=1 Tax=Novosphingobium sp. NDB2Meth1 TaxID=1892847 RepID=UPI000AE1A83A